MFYIPCSIRGDFQKTFCFADLLSNLQWCIQRDIVAKLCCASLLTKIGLKVSVPGEIWPCHKLRSWNKKCRVWFLSALRFYLIFWDSQPAENSQAYLENLDINNIWLKTRNNVHSISNVNTKALKWWNTKQVLRTF